jgi:hypothetical protein
MAASASQTASSPSPHASGNFQVGVQPQWAHTEACGDIPEAYLSEVLSEEVGVSLRTRGFCVVEIDTELRAAYDRFHDGLQRFMARTPGEKAAYACTYDDGYDCSTATTASTASARTHRCARYSANSLHGYSVVAELKEQWMYRRSAGEQHISLLSVPDELQNSKHLYQCLDTLCRRCARQCLPEVDRLLDPVPMPEGYISSSLLDSFHYRADETRGSHHANSHAAHTDSGLLTAVVTADVPALELLDQRLQRWVPIEFLIHQRCGGAGTLHRRFCTLFWGDSLSHAAQPEAPADKSLTPHLHRVAGAHCERFSVVFKQRCVPLLTAPRYGEDYFISRFQERFLA